jgi:lysozyme family protein
MSAVDDMLAALVKREGGYSNNPKDSGGATRYGITEQVARAFGYCGDMRMLPQDKAIEIYRQRYWIDPKFYDVSLRYPILATKLFDTGVNMGPQTATRFLQRALNGLNRAATEFPDMKEDGSIGQMTLSALDAFKTRRGDAGETVLMNAVTGQQIVRYIELAEKNSDNEAFLYGWLANRVSLA